MNFALPIDRLSETDTLIAIFHPQPAYPFHVLLLPRIEIPDLLSLDAQQPAFLQDVFITTQQIVKDYHLEQHGYRLILNGGPNQEFPLMHFHLIAEINPKTKKEHE
jgi:histidine triad (HIT) family protein